MTDIANVIELAEFAILGNRSTVRNELSSLIANLIEDPDAVQRGREDEYAYLAVLLDELGLHEEAINLLEPVNGTSAPGEHEGDAILRNMQGLLIVGAGEYLRAIELFEQALNAAHEGSLLHGKIIANLAMTNLRAGETASARNWLVEAENMRQIVNDPAIDVLIESVAAGVARVGGDLDNCRSALAALADASRSRILQLQNLDHPQALTALANVAYLKFDLATSEEASNSQRQAIGVLEVASRRLSAELGTDHPQSMIASANLLVAEAEFALGRGESESLRFAISKLEELSSRMDIVMGVLHPQARAIAQDITSVKTALTFVEALTQDDFPVAARLLQPAEDRSAQAEAYSRLGDVAQQRNRFDEAEAAYRYAIRLYSETDDQHAIATTCHNLAIVMGRAGRLADAEAVLRQALNLYRRTGDQHATATAFRTLGEVAQRQDHLRDAEAAYRQALNLYWETDDQQGTAATCHNLGILVGREGRFADAEVTLRQALDLYRRTGDRHATAAVFHNLGEVAQEQDRPRDAEAAYRQALDLYSETGDEQAIAFSYYNLGILAGREGRFTDAEAILRRAMHLYQETDPRQASVTETQLALLLLASGRNTQAANTLLDAALSWHRLTGGWASIDLSYLKQVRETVGEETFKDLVGVKVSGEMRATLIDAIDSFEDDDGATHDST